MYDSYKEKWDELVSNLPDLPNTKWLKNFFSEENLPQLPEMPDISLNKGKFMHYYHTRAVVSSIIGGGGLIFMYTCSCTIKTIDFKRNELYRTRIYEYQPPPPNYQACYGPAYCNRQFQLD